MIYSGEWFLMHRKVTEQKVAGQADSIERGVRTRYADAARTVEPALCCPSAAYDEALLDRLPEEIAAVDYGCGNPTEWLVAGETVLDLGSGSGKVCYLASQVVGERGHVLGVDFNAPMLELARKHQADFADRIGFDNMVFKRGRIQDLALDLDELDRWLAKHPVTDADGYERLAEQIAEMRRERPMIADDSVDCIVSNCVLNLVQPADKDHLFAEMFRVLKRGGRCVISDIVSDEDVPESMQRDVELWSGCISGAYREDRFIEAFERAGYHGIEVVRRAEEPWRVVEGIEFRSVTVRAFKGKQGPCLDRNQAVIYRGPWKTVVDDDGHTLYRGQRMAVCDKTFRIYTQPPYADQVFPVEPRVDVPLDDAKPFDCRRNARRDPRETKGAEYCETTDSGGDGCDSAGGCC